MDIHQNLISSENSTDTGYMDDTMNEDVHGSHFGVTMDENGEGQSVYGADFPDFPGESLDPSISDGEDGEEYLGECWGSINYLMHR